MLQPFTLNQSSHCVIPKCPFSLWTNAKWRIMWNSKPLHLICRSARLRHSGCVLQRALSKQPRAHTDTHVRPSHTCSLSASYLGTFGRYRLPRLLAEAGWWNDDPCAAHDHWRGPSWLRLSAGLAPRSSSVIRTPPQFKSVIILVP